MVIACDEQLKLPAGATVAEQLVIVTPPLTVVVIVIAPPPLVSGVNPVPLTVNGAPFAPVLGDRVIAGVVTVKVA